MVDSLLRYLALGDSYTIGESVEAHERWPVQLAALAREQHVPLAKPEIVASSGWTTDELAAALDDDPPHGTFDLVSLQIGVNNQYRGRKLEVYRAEFQDLLRTAAIYARGEIERVLVLSIPDWSVTPYAADRDRAATAAAIDRFNAVSREETSRAGACFVDITPLSRTAADDPTLLAEDELHPSGLMYGAWAGLALPHVLAILAPSS